MVMFTEQQWRIFNRIRRKYKVSIEFLKYNMPNIIKFVAFYARRLHFVLKRTAEPSRRNHSLVLKYNCQMRSPFDETSRKRIKRRKRNIKQWSKLMVQYLRKTKGIKEYIKIKRFSNVSREEPIKWEEVAKQLKEQLELLKSGKRSTQLMDCSFSESETKSGNSSLEIIGKPPIEFTSNEPDKENEEIHDDDDDDKLILNEKTGILESNSVEKMRECNNATTKEVTVAQNQQTPTKSSANILDLLMSKVCVKTTVPSSINKVSPAIENDPGIDSGEDFLGFAEDENIPGLMRTPLVPTVLRSKVENSVFVSESLDEYFRENSLSTNADVGQLVAMQQSNQNQRQANIDGLMQVNCTPPVFEMPAVPESLQKLRTVAERRHFLQKFSKNIKLAIINNEAAIYRELQRKIRNPKTKISSQQAMQAKGSQMSFTRQGWQAASFVATELNRFFFQKLFIQDEKLCVELRGVCGNNAEQFKTPYSSRITSQSWCKCTVNCIDCHIIRYLRPISKKATKKKLCKEPYRSIFKPCPLSEKPRQPLQDDDAAEILLSGGGMTVVRLPTIELQVYPQLGKPLNEVAKRYLQHILPYDKITREWAEFSTSTLQSSYSRCKNLENPPKSFTFTVPYVNDRSHILVRRVVNRSEKIDPYFLSNPPKPKWSGLSFCANIDMKNSTQVECADLLTDMINSVAISCSENSFIKEDLDPMNSSKNPNETSEVKGKRGRKKLAISEKTTVSKKNRLISELRRLNATIIETNAQHKNDNRRCLNEYCALGCVCKSLSDGYPMQQHCGKLKCMLQCSCKITNPSQIIRIETDGRSITTEDAYNMRRQATARLARIEKDFTSTVVVTENETLLINETEYDKKRRCTKVPKRYQDYRDTDNEFGRISPVKSCSTTPHSDVNDSRNSPSSATITEIMSDLHEPLYIKDTILKQLKHCSIPLVPFRDIQNMATWCMIHRMYNCFCGGHALEGKPLLIEKEDTKLGGSPDNDGNKKMNFSAKAYYSFENTESNTELMSSPQSVSVSTPKRRDSFTNKTADVKRLPTDDLTDVEKSTIVQSDDFKIAAKLEIKESTATRHISDYFKNYFKRREHLGCSRFMPVPSLKYKSINRKRRDDVLEDIEYMEDKKSQLLLNEHIMRSVYFHKEELEAKKIKEELPENNKMQAEENSKLKVPLPLAVKEEEVESVISPENETLNSSRDTNSTVEKSKSPKRDLPLADRLQSPIEKKRKIIESTEKIESVQQTEKTDEMKEFPITESREEVNNESVNVTNNLSVPTISGCYSLKSQTEYSRLVNNQLATPTNTTESALSAFPQGVRENYNEIIKMLNSLVSRKMHDIDNALKRDSKIVPPPTENVLCVLQWKNFLGAYDEGLIYIWEVKMKSRTFLAATITNMMPMVLGALAVISLTETPVERLPLIGRMVLQGNYLEKTTNLAVIMQGRQHYWFIKGFLQPNVANTCLRPTPETHPELTKKINTLCSALIKQRTRDIERRETTLTKQAKEISHANASNPIEMGQNLTTKQQQKPYNSILKCNLRPSVDNFLPPSVITKPNDQANQATEEILKFQTQCKTQNAVVEIEKNRRCNSAKLSQTNWVSNIQLQKPNASDINEIFLPKIRENEESWYVLNLNNDFSHIFVPVQKEIVSLDRIQRLIEMSDEKQKVVHIEFLKRTFFDAFIVPNSKRKIYFGPFPFNSKPPLLVLLQSVDGKMMTRETYQCLHNIPHKSMQTTAFWLKQKNGKICFDELIENKQIENIETQCSTTVGSAAFSAKDSEDDCFIVENTDLEMPKMNESNSIKLPEMLTQQKSSRLVITENSIKLNLQTPDNTKTDLNLPPTAKHTTNFTIQAVNTKSQQEILPPITSKNNSSPIVQSMENSNSKDLLLQHQKIITQRTQTISPLPAVDSQTKIGSPQIQVSKAVIITHYNPLTVTASIPNITTTTNTTTTPAVNHTIIPQDSTIPTANDVRRYANANRLPVQTSVLSNPSTAVANSTCYPVGKILSAAKPIALQRVAVKNMSLNTANPPKNIATPLRIASTTTSTLTNNPVPKILPTLPMQQMSNTSTANNVSQQKTSTLETLLRNTGSPKTPTPTSTSAPIAQTQLAESNIPPQIAKGITIKRLTSGVITIPQNVLESAKSATVMKPQNPSTSTIVKLLTNPTKPAAAVTSKPETVTRNSPEMQSIQSRLTGVNAANAVSTSSRKTLPNLQCIPKTIASSTHPTTPDITQQSNLRNSPPVKRMRYTIHTNAAANDSLTTTLPNQVPVSSTDLTVDDDDADDSQSSPSVGTSTKPIESVYGYFCSNKPGVPRFLAKRTQFEYVIKIPGYGLVKANGILKANAFLTQHVAKICSLSNAKMCWNFVVQTNVQSAQNKGSNALKILPIQPKSSAIGKEKVTTSPNMSTVSTPILKQKPVAARQTHPQPSIFEQITCIQQPKHTICETILIDD